MDLTYLAQGKSSTVRCVTPCLSTFLVLNLMNLTEVTIIVTLTRKHHYIIVFLPQNPIICVLGPLELYTHIYGQLLEVP